ncbi:MAG: SMC-Scp complex subunit ScpB [Candidatus Pacebacteria bacterium]|nr:SMC-Scp complex subunit ScpB [Candidatus Paceibacterota bacterium]
MENRAQKMQAILYAHGGEMKKSTIASFLGVDLTEINVYAKELIQLLDGQGLELLETTTTLSMRSSSEYAEFVSKLQKSNNEKDIGTAGLEVLAIVLYKEEGAGRASIDYIRGVNSSGTLRQLVLRGLLERIRNTQDARAWIYTVTPELLSHLNISSADQLPEYETLTKILNKEEEPQFQNE